MRRRAGLPTLVCVLLLSACSSDGLPPELPLVVTETSLEGTVQVTVDPEGAVFTNRNGETTTGQVPAADIDELRRLMVDADLDSLDGHSAPAPRFIVLAGDVEAFLGEEVPESLVPVIEWIREHRD